MEVIKASEMCTVNQEISIHKTFIFFGSTVFVRTVKPAYGDHTWDSDTVVPIDRWSSYPGFV